MSGYTIVRELGRGASGVVSLVRRKADSRLFAAKEILFTDIVERNQIMQEVALMQSLPQHPSLLALEEVLETRHSVTMILEYSSEGTLRDLVYDSKLNSTSSVVSRKAQGLPEADVIRYLTQLVNALAFLHSNNVLHRDIKLENLLLFSQKSVVKISDFGVATILGRTSTGQDRMAQTTAGTPHYMSPEVCEGHPYNYKSDVWSLGIAAYEMCAQSVPFNAANVLALSGKICHQATPELPAEYSRRLNAIIRSMLTKNQETRPSMKDVAAMLQHYRRKRADEAADGEDIGGFAFDPFIAPSMYDDDEQVVDPGKTAHDGTQSWGVPSMGAGPDDLTVWDDDDGSFTPRLDISTALVSQQAIHGDQVGEHQRFSPKIRAAILAEGRRIVAHNKEVEAEMGRVHHDDEDAVHRSKSPRLKSLIEELQDEIRKQTNKVEKMLDEKVYAGSSAAVQPSTDSLDNKLSSSVESEFSTQASLRHVAAGANKLSQRSSPPPQQLLVKPFAEGSMLPVSPPFADPAASTPSAVRKTTSPRRTEVAAAPIMFSPREGSGMVPAAPSSRPAAQHHAPGKSPPTQGLTRATPQSTPQSTPRVGKTSPPPHSHTHAHSNTPALPGQLNAVQSPTPRAGNVVAASAPKPPKMLVRHNADSEPKPHGAVHQPQASQQPPSQPTTTEPYFPPCAQCIKLAKERKSVVALDSSTDGSSRSALFVTIRPSKLYCSTCHAPFCPSCCDAVHDPITTYTNLSQSAPLNSSAKKHNLFFLSLTDPAAANVNGLIVNSSFGGGAQGGPASPTNSRRSLVTFHKDGDDTLSDDERANARRSEKSSSFGCCTVM